MKRKISLLILVSTLFLSFPLFAEVTIIPNNDNPDLMIGAITTGPSRRVTLDLFANDGATIPHYDEGSDSYHVPVTVETTVNVPDPDAVAYGDVTEHPVTIGTQGVVAVPGTDILKLADGTYTNAAPSQTLSDAYASVPTGIPVPAGDGSGGGLPVDTVGTWPNATNTSGLTLTDTYYHGIITGAPNSTVIGCQWIATPSQRMNTYFYYIGLRYNVVDPGYTCPDGKEAVRQYVYPAAASSLPDTEFPNEVNSSNLAGQLADDQANFASNGLADDYVNACAAGGSCSIAEGDLTQDDIDNWISTNTTTVNNIISGAISDGAAAAAADGTNTGAQQQQTGQLAGILSALNKLNNTSDDIKDKMDEGYELIGSATLSDDNSYDANFTQPVENSLSETVSSYILTGLPLTQFLNDSGFTVANADPRLTCDLWGSVVDFDISPMESILHWMGLIVFAVSTISAFMIVIKR